MPDSVWAKIQPLDGQGAGLLCITCMARRLSDAGMQNVPMKITAGVFRESSDPRPGLFSLGSPREEQQHANVR